MAQSAREEVRPNITPDLGPGHNQAAGDGSDPRAERTAAGDTSDPRGGNTGDSSAVSPSDLKGREESPDVNSEEGGLARNFSSGNKNSTSKGKVRFTRRKQAIAGIGSATIVGASFGFFSITSGPLQVIHYGQLLGKAFNHQESANNTRLSRDIRWLKTGDPGQTRIGYISSKYILPHIKAEFANQGIEFRTNAKGNLATINIDIAANDKYHNLSETQARTAIAADYGVSPSSVTVNPIDNTWEVGLDKLSISDRRSAIRTYVDNQDLGWLASKVRFRELTKYYNVTNWLTPMRHISNLLDEKFSDPKFLSTAKDYAKKRAQPLTERTAAARQQVADIKSKLGDKFNLFNNLGQISSIGICATKDIVHAIPEVNRANVVVPAMLAAGDALALGSEVQAGGKNFTASQVGAVVKYFSDSNGKTPWDGAAIRSLNGGTGGVDVKKDVKQAFSPDSTARKIEQDLNTAGADALCSPLGQLAQGFLGISSVVAGPGAVLVKGFTIVAGSVFTGAAISGFTSLITNLAADQPITGTPHQGPDGGNVDAYGARELAFTQSTSMGGTTVSGTTTALLDKQQNLADRQQFQSESLASRMFNVHDYRSLASRVIDSQSPNASQNIASLFSSLLHVSGSLFGSVSSFFPRAQADPKPYDYGFPEVIIDQNLLSPSDQALVDDYRTNADAVATILNNPSNYPVDYINKASICFGVKIDNTTDGSWDVFPDHDVNRTSSDYLDQHCGDINDKNWLRVSYFVWDTSLMEGWACTLGDDQSCQNSGFGTPTAAGGGTTAPPSTATPKDYFTVVGNRINDPNGKEFIPYGISVVDDLDQPDWQNHAAASDAQIQAAAQYWHSNTIRLQVSEKVILDNPTSAKGYNEAAMQRLGTEIDAIESLGKVPIINDNVEQSDNGQTSATNRTSDFWKKVTEYFSSQDSTKYANVVFDIFNEPHNIDWSTWQKEKGGSGYVGMQDVVNAIRGESNSLNNNLIMVEGPYVASTLSQLDQYPITGSNLAFAFHHQDLSNQGSWDQNTGVNLNTKVPLIDGEWAQYASTRPECYSDGDRVTPTYLSYLRSHNIGMIFWSLEPGVGTVTNNPQPVSDRITSAYPTDAAGYSQPTTFKSNYSCTTIGPKGTVFQKGDKAGDTGNLIDQGAGREVMDYFNKYSVDPTGSIGTAGSTPTGNAQDLAKQLLPFISSGKITCGPVAGGSGPADCLDIQNTAKGIPIGGNCAVPSLTPHLLGLILGLVQNDGWTLGISAICSNHHSEGDGPRAGHSYGSAADFSIQNGASGAAAAADEKFVNDAAALLASSGGSFGQTQCHPAYAVLNNPKFTTFADGCTHQHIRAAP